MRTYRNTVTGAIIDIPSELCGGLWVEVKPSPKATVNKAEEEAPKKTTKKTTKRA